MAYPNDLKTYPPEMFDVIRQTYIDGFFDIAINLTADEQQFHGAAHPYTYTKPLFHFSLPSSSL